MDGNSSSESSENLIFIDEVESPTILLPWYSSGTTCGVISSSGRDEDVPLAWYPSLRNRDQELGSECEENLSPPWDPRLTKCVKVGSCSEKASTSANPQTNLISHFVGMGFPMKMVEKSIEENGDNNSELVLETLLTYSALEESPSICEPVPCDTHASESDNDILDDLSDSYSCLEDEEDVEQLPDEDKKLLHLIEMGFTPEEASSAIGTSGPDTSVMELMDFIYASQTAKTADPLQEPPQSIYDDEIGPSDYRCYPLKTVKKRKFFESEEERKRKLESRRDRERIWRQNRKSKSIDTDDMSVHIPKQMIGFGVSDDPGPLFKRNLPEAALGPPYFYYENVACTPKGVWTTISRFLYEIEPEFVDSLHFCSAARKRGYVHNLPVDNRFRIQPIPPLTIQEALPMTKKWWPSWDARRKLNCLNTCFASAKLTQRIRDALERWDGEPPLDTQKDVLLECRKWNLVWTGKNKVAPLEPDEIELILGYPKDHTRGGGVNRTDRYKGLGNSFQVDTVAYHFSVLKRLFPNGVRLLSLFSGIGGAEVALHRLGIPLKSVVSVEISEVNRNIIRSWWEQTNQKGTLIELEDVQQLTQEKLESLISSLGGFDLIVGGSPCNNLTGSNRVSRDGLEGEHSILFYDYFRIINTIRSMMHSN